MLPKDVVMLRTHLGNIRPPTGLYWVTNSAVEDFLVPGELAGAAVRSVEPREEGGNTKNYSKTG
jgi:hypothetical protein